MARQGFKRWWTLAIPKSVERFTYVLLACLLLILLFWLWQPLRYPIWRIEQPVARFAVLGLFWLGWLVVAVAAARTNQREMLGFQVLHAAEGQQAQPPTLTVSGLYRFVRHPIYAGSLIAFWATPDMTAGHLLFSVLATAYIIVGARLEERDLVRTFGDRYRKYQKDVRMLLPLPK
jgi:methanethiol S-methyltransferase